VVLAAGHAAQTPAIFNGDDEGAVRRTVIRLFYENDYRADGRTGSSAAKDGRDRKIKECKITRGDI
jgi:hypothetical protein